MDNTNRQESKLWKYLFAFKEAILEPLLLPFATFWLFAEIARVVEFIPSNASSSEAFLMDIRAIWIPILLFWVIYYIFLVIRGKQFREELKDKKEMRNTLDRINKRLDEQDNINHE